MAVVAPIPSAKVSMAVRVKIGDNRICLSAYKTSWRKVRIIASGPSVRRIIVTTENELNRFPHVVMRGTHARWGEYRNAARRPILPQGTDRLFAFRTSYLARRKSFRGSAFQG